MNGNDYDYFSGKLCDMADKIKDLEAKLAEANADYLIASDMLMVAVEALEKEKENADCRGEEPRVTRINRALEKIKGEQ